MPPSERDRGSGEGIPSERAGHSRLGEAIVRHSRLTAPSLPSLDPLRSKSKRILDRWPDVTAEPPEQDREQLVQKMKIKVDAGDWADTPMSFVVNAAWALFDVARRTLPDLKDLRRFYYAELKVSTKRAFLGGLFSVYLGTYDPGAGHSVALAAALSARSDALDGRAGRLVAGIPEVLDGNNAPFAIATRMIDMADPWSGLTALGPMSPHAPGLMDHAHLAYIGLSRERGLASKEAATTLIDWLKPAGREARQGGAAEAITALLEPWLTRVPPQDQLRYLTERLVTLYRDPRVDRGGAWSGVAKPAMDTFLRWLTGENIRFFLDVVSEVEDSHMWAPRRRFWLGLHEQGRIDAAWVAFDDAGAQLAHRRVSRRSDGATKSYGRQTAAGRATTSLLVMKIGRKIVVEGSHSYKIHIFDESSANAPRLYLDGYDCERIRHLPGALTKAHQRHWEGWVLENI